jgi:hypothetical protein
VKGEPGEAITAQDPFSTVYTKRFLLQIDAWHEQIVDMGAGIVLSLTAIGPMMRPVWAEVRVKSDHTKDARFVVMLPVAEQ